MKLRLRLALLFSFLVFVILLFSLSFTYLLYEKFRRDDFFDRVKENANLFSNAYLDSANGYNPLLPAAIKKDRFTLSEEHLILFDSSRRVIYSWPDSASLHIPSDFFLNAQKQGYYYFSDGYRESVTRYLDKPGKTGYFYASAYDKFGRRKIENLKLIMFLTLIGGLLLSGLLAFFYVKQIIKPIAELTQKMQYITDNNIFERITLDNNDNEINRIARNFNQMLDRLNNAVETRKRFVQQASHELRTPLTNMLAQTEVALTKTLSPEESHLILRSLKEDQQHMIDLTNSLLLLSKYEKLPFLKEVSPLRVDEVLFEAVDSVKINFQDTRIAVNFNSMPEHDGDLTIMGNDILLNSALQNLITNACYYTDDNEVQITIDTEKNWLKLTFDNHGRQLSNEEQQRLFIPFFRGENSINKKGFGLGLSIVHRIIQLHKGTITYSAVNHRLNRFVIVLPLAKA